MFKLKKQSHNFFLTSQKVRHPLFFKKNQKQKIKFKIIAPVVTLYNPYDLKNKTKKKNKKKTLTFCTSCAALAGQGSGLFACDCQASAVRFLGGLTREKTSRSLGS